MELYQQAARSLVKKYRKPIWNRFIGGIKDYALIQPGDRVAVCISGGKDSMLLALCMQHLHKYTEVPFEVRYLAMDPGYAPQNRALLESNCEALHVPVQIFQTDIFAKTQQSEKSPCYHCARMRRGWLYKEARTIGCNKIALGHHFDDVIETVLMSLLYAAEMRTMMPKLHSRHYPGMELIRPLYLVHEQDILAWQRYNGLHFLQCACRFTEQPAQARPNGGKRARVKSLIRELRAENPQVDRNIFHSVHSVNLETLIGWREGKTTHSFLDSYEEGHLDDGT